MQYFTPDFLQFFKELASNNRKDWFDLNRSRYEKEIKLPMQIFIQDLINEMAKKDKKIKIGAKDAIFRINKDVRFSKDKSPYKLNTSAIISPEGRANKDYPGLYIELGPEHVRVYQGAYMIDTAKLEQLRKYIAKNLTAFNKLVMDKKFIKHFGVVLGEQQVRLPKELKEKAEKQPLILNKQFYWFAEFEPEVCLKKDFMKKVITYHETGKPLMEFITKGLGYK